MTCQIPDRIEYENETLACYSEPLRPRLPRSAGINVGHSDSLYPFQVSCTALWRGYIGHWKIKDDRLYLVALGGTQSDGEVASLTTVFPDCDGPVFADWYTGDLDCPRGKVIGQIDSFYLNVYEETVLLRIVAGVVTGTEIRRNEVPVTVAEDDQNEDRW